jgi:DNA-binding response OmpR family regulator|tara:strand:- start:12695 stop:13393 length:699 start_codon:yes stop_codon:yes gene_type:complete
MSTNVLIIDDDKELCALLADFLSLEGFETQAIHDGAEAVAHCRHHDHDAIVLDIMLPGLQGLDVLRQVRQFSTTPILMLTARGEDTDRILGLELGADDYLPKPCNPRELSARLRAILRRGNLVSEDVAAPTLEAGQTAMNTADRSATYGGADLQLTSTEFNVLQVLVTNAGTVVSKDLLSQNALGRALSAYDRSIDVHISKIRRKLAALGGDNLIVSVRGSGYQFRLGAGAT